MSLSEFFQFMIMLTAIVTLVYTISKDIHNKK